MKWEVMKVKYRTIFIIWYNIFQIHVLKNELQCYLQSFAINYFTHFLVISILMFRMQQLQSLIYWFM